MRRTLIVAWSPAAVLLACLAASALAGVTGHRALREMADAQLVVAGDYVAHHVQSVLASRLRVLEGAAAMDAPPLDGTERARTRRAMIESLSRLHPEFVWIGFADRPGRIAVAQGDLLAGGDVSGRDWWSAALRGPYLGGVHEARRLAPAPGADDRPGTVPVEPTRLFDVAVPLRGADGEAYGVLAAHVDVSWLISVRDELAEVAGPLGDVDVLVLQRDGTTLSGRRVRFDPAGASNAPGVRDGALDDRPRTFSVHPVDGDVVVARLGWSVAVGRDPAVHEAPARRFLGWSIAAGAVIGALGGIAVAWASDAGSRRAAA